jgi:predicted permease
MVMVDKVVATAAIQAAINLMTSICIGGWAATKNLGGIRNAAILDGVALQSLSKLVYWIFQPAFLLNSVARTIYDATTSNSATATVTATTMGMPIHLLFLMLICAIIHIGFGSIIGMIITRTFTVRSYPTK